MDEQGEQFHPSRIVCGGVAHTAHSAHIELIEKFIFWCFCKGADDLIYFFYLKNWNIKIKSLTMYLKSRGEVFILPSV